MDEIDEIRAKNLAELQSYAREKAAPKTAAPIHLTDATFATETGLGGVALVDLWAAWCGPCVRIAPEIERVAADYAGKVRVYKLNVDENPVTPGQYGVQSIPTLMIFKDGKLVDAIIGAVPRAEIDRTLQRWT